MRTTFRFLAVMTLAAGAIGCGSDEPAATTLASTTTMAVASLDEMLLTADEVGPMWREGESITEADLTDSVQVPCPDMALNPTISTRLRAQSGAQFDTDDASYRHVMEFIVSGQPQQLDADLEAWFGALASCAAEGVATAANETLLSMEPLTIPGLGDQRLAYVTTAKESADATAVWHMRSAIVRVGGVAITFGLVEILDGAGDVPVVDDAEYVAMLERAVTKIGG